MAALVHCAVYLATEKEIRSVGHEKKEQSFRQQAIINHLKKLSFFLFFLFHFSFSFFCFVSFPEHGLEDEKREMVLPEQQ